MSEMTLTAAEPATPAAVRRPSPPTTIVCRFWNVAATTATPENGVVVARRVPVRTGIVPEVPWAVI